MTPPNKRAADEQQRRFGQLHQGSSSSAPRALVFPTFSRRTDQVCTTVRVVSIPAQKSVIGDTGAEPVSGREEYRRRATGVRPEGRSRRSRGAGSRRRHGRFGGRGCASRPRQRRVGDPSGARFLDARSPAGRASREAGFPAGTTRGRSRASGSAPPTGTPPEGPPPRDPVTAAADSAGRARMAAGLSSRSETRPPTPANASGDSRASSFRREAISFLNSVTSRNGNNTPPPPATRSAVASLPTSRRTRRTARLAARGCTFVRPQAPARGYRPDRR